MVPEEEEEGGEEEAAQLRKSPHLQRKTNDFDFFPSHFGLRMSGSSSTTTSSTPAIYACMCSRAQLPRL